MTAGLSSASFCWIASAVRYSASASAGLPVCRSSSPRLLWLFARSAAEFGDGGVVVGQLLLDRQRPAVLGLRLRRLARGQQQDAEVDGGCSPVPFAGRCPSGPPRRGPPGGRGPARSARRASAVRPMVRRSQPARVAGVGEGRPGRRVLGRAAVAGRQHASAHARRSPAPRRFCRWLPAPGRRPRGCAPRRPPSPGRPPASFASASRPASTRKCSARASSLRPT